MIDGHQILSSKEYLERGDYLLFKTTILFILFYFIFSIFFLLLLRQRYLFAFLICLLILLTGSVLHILGGYVFGGWGTDDAYVSYLYARNLVQGHGLVFNPGERVEGYSNFLYVLLMSLGHIIANVNIYAFSSVANLFFLIAAFIIFYGYAKSRFGDIKAALAMFLFSFSLPVWIWVASGMEVALVLLLQIAILLIVERLLVEEKLIYILTLCLAMMFSILARADGFILPIIAILFLLFKARGRSALFCSISVILTVSIYFLWRYNYYGHFLPNSYYLKAFGQPMVRFASAIKRLGNIAIKKGLLVYILIFLFSLGDAIRNKKIRFSTVFGLSWLLYWIYIGGDSFDERFLVVLYPLGIFTLLEYIPKALNTKIISSIILIAMLQLIPLYNIFDPDRSFEYSFSKYDPLITLGKFLGRNYAGKTLAAEPAGKLPYFSGLRTIDMLGANDEHIAHKKIKEVDHFVPGHIKFDPDYVLSRKPDIIVAWAMLNPDIDLYTGLTREKYERAGYFIRYVVNNKRDSSDSNIIDVKNLDRTRIAQLISKGYKWIVLERKYH